MSDSPTLLFHKLDSKTFFQELLIIKKLEKSRFPIYLVRHAQTKTKFILKAFPFTPSGAVSKHYKNEIRFKDLKHTNIIIPYLHQEQLRFSAEDEPIASCVVMEYAPFGTIQNLLNLYGKSLDEVLARTYFRQLIEGLEYLHSNKVSHLDIKLENLLIGEDFQLKIIDFEMSYIEGDKRVSTMGTESYRAPELANGDMKNPQKADVYSAGIILFLLKSQGHFPHMENADIFGFNLSELLYTDNEQFWTKHCELEGRRKSYYGKQFRELFNSMTHIDQSQRPTIKEIKESKWYNGEILSGDQLKKMLYFLSKTIKCRPNLN